MAEYDEERQKLTIKLVYYGPAQSGKTTNLMYLHDILQPQLKGELMTLETQNDRTLFFDLFPLGFKAPSGLLVKFRLYTVPGQVIHDSTRKAVLSRADGVVFVADSQRTQGVNNAESFQNLADNASRVGLDFKNLPLVVQFNKRDLANIYSEEEIRGRWEKAPWPLVFGSALEGYGVEETFRLLLSQVYETLDRCFGFESGHDLDKMAFVMAVLGQAREVCT